MYSNPCGDSSTSAPEALPRSTPPGPLAGSASRSNPASARGMGLLWLISKNPLPPRCLLWPPDARACQRKRMSWRDPADPMVEGRDDRLLYVWEALIGSTNATWENAQRTR